MQFTVTPEFIRKGNLRHIIDSIGKSWLGAFGICLAAVLFSGPIGLDKQTIRLLMVPVLITPVMWVIGYSTMLWRSNERYRRMASKEITFRFTGESVTTCSDLGTAEVPWRMMDKIRRYPEMWLLYFGKNAYIYVPTEKMDEGLKELILRKASELGVKVK
ncbi:MAG: YcxB family protein [Chthonomonadales bacterium]